MRLRSVPAFFLLVSTLQAEPIDYGRDIRPLLSDRCFKCHGPDRAVGDNDLRLDVRDEAIASAIVAGNPEESELIIRITTDDESLKMPPVDSERKPLTEAEIDLLKRWIASGAPYAEHWAYVAPQQPPLPEVQDANWPTGEIDRFTLKNAEDHGLTPAQSADKRTLVRRLYFDLLGLPPTPEQIDAFIADDAPDAYERLVDRLLGSEHYGERMAMHWLDLVRYADTTGYHGDNERNIDAYRDYVIDAFNGNKPFDQFTVEQLAGDLLPNPTQEQRIASGYNRLLQTTSEGGAQAKEYVTIYQADRVRNVSSVWMASTMACCQCHDHKFDPFTIKDFYSMAAFFADIKEPAVGLPVPNLKLPTSEQTAKIEDLTSRLKAARENPAFVEGLANWIASQRALLQDNQEDAVAGKPSDATSLGGGNMAVLPDGGVAILGEVPATDVYRITFPATEERITGIHLNAMIHSGFLKDLLNRENGNFILTELEVALKEGETLTPLKLRSVSSDYETKDHPAQLAIDGDPKTGWLVESEKHPRDCTAIFLLEEPVAGGEGKELVVTLRQESERPFHTIGHFRLSMNTSDNPTINPLAGLPANVVAILKKKPEDETPADKKAMEATYRKVGQDHEAERKAVTSLEFQLAVAEKAVRATLVTESMDKPREVRVLPRGSWLDETGEVVLPAIPTHLGALETGDQRATRLDLAKWIADANNPLTARVFVNRVWGLFFGEGIVRTLEDVGYQSEWPTHPELLDWLSVDFVQHGWDVKRLVKQIVMSQTYRQSSQGSEASHQQDPFNRFLARQARFRLSAEMIRDNALSISGLLVNDVGGRSVKPYQPAGYWRHLNFPAREWESDKGASQYRRGIYTFWCRSFLHPSLLAFDATSREECTAARPRSNTPLQALVLLNDPTYVEAARVFAAEVLEQPGDDSARINRIWQQALQRDPSAAETEVVLELLNSERTRTQQDASLAAKIVENGLSPTPAAANAAELAAWTAVARTILNLHETITRY